MRVTSVMVGAAALALAAALAACTPVPKGGPDPSGSGVNNGSPAGSPGFGGPSGAATATATPTGTGASDDPSGGTGGGTGAASPSHTSHSSPAHHPGLDMTFSVRPDPKATPLYHLTVHLTGWVYEPVDYNSRQRIALHGAGDTQAITSADVDWGRGEDPEQTDDQLETTYACGHPHVLHHVDLTVTYPHGFRRSSPKPVHYTVHACGLPKDGVTKSLRMPPKLR